ncbi:hypothetical protein G6F57_016660 [Rhizopus arrhizus]|nr:hypothetical protein G6F57_016660 [Rhizopus arrhizus]
MRGPSRPAGLRDTRPAAGNAAVAGTILRPNGLWLSNSSWRSLSCLSMSIYRRRAAAQCASTGTLHAGQARGIIGWYARRQRGFTRGDRQRARMRAQDDATVFHAVDLEYVLPTHRRGGIEQPCDRDVIRLLGDFFHALVALSWRERELARTQQRFT